MLALAATYSIDVDGNSYASTLQYRLRPAPNSSEAVPTRVQMRVVMRGEAERLMQFLTSRTREPIRLREEDSVPLLQVRGEGPWRLVQAVLQFFDQRGRPVAKAQIPVFVSSP